MPGCDGRDGRLYRDFRRRAGEKPVDMDGANIGGRVNIIEVRRFSIIDSPSHSMLMESWQIERPDAVNVKRSGRK